MNDSKGVGRDSFETPPEFQNPYSAEAVGF
jgi:hypothetical protein